jgi:hypothetical protein
MSMTASNVATIELNKSISMMQGYKNGWKDKKKGGITSPRKTKLIMKNCNTIKRYCWTTKETLMGTINHDSV